MLTAMPRAVTNARPLYDMVLIQLEPLKPRNGIVLPDSVKNEERPQCYARVLRTPPPKEGTVEQFKEGDRILFVPRGMIPIEDGGPDVFIINKGFIMAVFEESA